MTLLRPLAATLLALSIQATAQAPTTKALTPKSTQIRLVHRLEVMALETPDAAPGFGLMDQAGVLAVYEALGPDHLWVTPERRFTPAALALLQSFSRAERWGLAPEDYQPPWQWDLAEAELTQLSDGLAVDAELYLSDRLLVLSQHLKHGKVNPETLTPVWQAEPELVQSWINAVTEARPTPERIQQWLNDQLPKQKSYRLLANELERLHSSAERTAPILDILLKPGMDHPQVSTVRRILSGFGYLNADHDSPRYDEPLRRAVMAFQEAHSLVGDAQVGPATRQALQQIVTGDTNTVRVNMERWRWMPETYGPDFILVNIANFHLRYYHEGEEALTMKTIVGKQYRKTPVFSKDMKYLVINPSWSVPHTIARKDLLPKIQANPSYLSEMGIRVFQGWGPAQVEVDPASVDWQQVKSSRFPYHFRQMPGEKNALGQVKFMLPNEHDVYLHDTSDKTLFSKSQRAFSSGCIRLEKPLDLLDLVVKNHTRSSAAAVQKALDSKAETTLLLSSPLPVHIQYWTTWVDNENRIHYRFDIYERDAAILKALQQPWDGRT